LGVGTNKAFFEANNYINHRKIIKKKVNIVNCKLVSNKSKKNIFINDKHNNIKNCVVNNNTGVQGSTNGNTEPPTKDKENFNSINSIKNYSTNIKK
jgi:hypothetical protein